MRGLTLVALAAGVTPTAASCWGCMSYTPRSMYMITCNWHLSCCTAVSAGNSIVPQASFPWSVPLEFDEAAVIGPLNAFLSRLGHDTSSSPAFSLKVTDGKFRVCNGICSNSVWQLTYYTVGFARYTDCVSAVARINANRPSYTGPTLQCAEINGYGYVYINELASKGQCESAVASIEASAKGVACDRGQFQGPTLYECSSCPVGTYQAASQHFDTGCQPQPPCEVGTYFHSDATTERACPPCPGGTYQDSISHREVQCTAQPTCGAGQSYTAISLEAERTCTACPVGTFIAEKSHRNEVCVMQPTCGEGETYPQESLPLTAMRVCTPCPPHTFESAESHRNVICKAQPPCGVGEVYEGGVTRMRTCSPCPTDSYQGSTSHRDAQCKAQPTCGAGQSYNATSLHVKRTCTVCGAGKFIAEEAHRKSACGGQPACGPGENYPQGPLPVTAMRVCTPCPPHTFESAHSHRNLICKPQPNCSTGQKFVDSLTAIRACVPCEAEGYQDSNSHQDSECIPQPLCGAGLMLNDLSGAHRGSCVECPESTYQDSIYHRSANCILQPPCGAGEMYPVNLLLTALRTCRPCPIYTYQASLSHHATSCTVQPTCGSGHTYTATATHLRTCTPCNSGSYQPSTEHRISSCLEQPICVAGQRLDGSSSTVGGVCEPCPKDTFQRSNHHRTSFCTVATDTTCTGGRGDFTPELGCTCVEGFYGNACHLKQEDDILWDRPVVLIGFTTAAIMSICVVWYALKTKCGCCCKAKQDNTVRNHVTDIVLQQRDAAFEFE
jgi:hypothetical protein